MIILGPKASTCFRRVFIVFPVPTMAYGKAEAQKLMKEGQKERKRDSQVWKHRPERHSSHIDVEMKKLFTLCRHYITVYV